MLVRETIQNTKNFFHKPLQNLKSFFCVGYEKIPKTSTLSCLSRSSKNHKTDQFYADFCNEWEFDLEKAKKRKKNSILVSEEPVIEEDGSFFAKQSPVKNKQEEGVKKEKKLRASRSGKGEEQSNSNQIKKEGYALAQKMKELDMMDVSDVEHVLDVEEALHYYSRLKSPVYLDIVDNFFMDMYSELSVPKASVSINNSKRRLGSIRL